MCIIIYSPTGKIPKSYLAESIASNPDGWGVMWPEYDKLQIMTGLEGGEFFKHWKWLKKLNVPIVFHARISTHGTKTLENCHPFVIPNHGELAVAHNGTIIQQGFKGDKSDTRHFVDNILAFLPDDFQKYEVYHELIESYIGHSKLVFMDGQGDVNIMGEGLGHWRGDMWFSNKSYLPWVPPPCKKKSIGFVGNQGFVPSTASVQQWSKEYYEMKKGFMTQEEKTAKEKEQWAALKSRLESEDAAREARIIDLSSSGYHIS